MTKCERINELLSGLLDGELTQQDRQRVEIHVETCANCRQLLDELKGQRDSIGQLSFGELTPEERRDMVSDLPTKATRGLGWLLAGIALLVLCGNGVYHFLRDENVQLLVKIATVGFYFGGFLLFLTVLRERLRDRKTDNYKDIEI